MTRAAGLDDLLAALRGEDRAAALQAAFALGASHAGAAGSADGAAALAALDQVAADPATGAWLRKRCKRAAQKIRAAGPEQVAEERADLKEASTRADG